MVSKKPVQQPIPLTIARVGVLQIKDDTQSGVEVAKFFAAEVSDAVAQAAGIDRRSLFGEYASRAAVDFNLWSKARGSR